MEEILLTDGQFQRLLNATNDPATYTGQIRSLVVALHDGQRRAGNKWLVKMNESDIAEALTIFEDRKRTYRTPGDTMAWTFFVNDSPTARRLHDERKAQGDVPRETSSEES